MQYTIREVAQRTGLTASALRYYEREGLLCAVQRNGGGRRVYNEQDMDWLGIITCLKNTGMSLKQIKAFMDLSAAGRETLPKRCEMLVAHKRSVESKLAEMQKQLEKITQKIACYAAQYERSKSDEQTKSSEN